MTVSVRTIRNRLWVVLIILAVLMVLLIFRVGYWNIVRGADLQKDAEGQWISDDPVMAKRGSILDRNMNVLAQSAVSDTVVLMPNTIKDADYVADTLSAVLEMPRETVFEKASTKTKTDDKGKEKEIGEVWLKRQITNEQSEEIKAIQALEGNPLKGVKLISDVKRFYPNKDFASQIIGYTTMDGVGQTGIERRYNSILEGRQGRIVAETDKFNNDIPNGREMVIQPVDGKNVVLTIDDVFQSFLETNCKEAYQSIAPESVQGAIMDVSNGEMLAIANVPDFDLNTPPREDGELLSSLSANIMTASTFQPGSVLDLFTLAGAIDSNTVASSYKCEGKITIDGEEITCSEAHGAQTPGEVLQNGCAVGASMMASDMGKTTLFEYMRKFGFGEATGIDFSTDASGDLMAMKYASDSDVSKIGIGENLKVSQMQLLNAAASIANGGTLYTPRLVLGLADADGTMREYYETQAKGETVNTNTVSGLKSILQQNVVFGNATDTKMASYTSGAICGTVQKYDTDGVLVPGKQISMCIVFAPVNDPKYIVMVTLNSVDVAEDVEQAAAPYAAAIMEEILQYTYVEPDGDGNTQVPGIVNEETTVAVPNVVEMALQIAIDSLSDAGLDYTTDGAGTVVEQVPAAGEQVAEGTAISLIMDHKTPQPSQGTEGDSSGMVEVPDFTGLSFAEARELAISKELRFYAQGKGVAKSQYPQAGTSVGRGSAITVGFKLNLE